LQNHIRAAALALMPLLLLSQTACLTPRLWNEAHEKSFREPASDPRLIISQSTPHNDFLVQYDEHSERNEAIVRRAFFLKANRAKLERSAKPAFVNPALAQTLPTIPIATPDAPAGPVPRAIAENQGRRFTVLDHTGAIGPVDLPVYPERMTNIGRDLARVALTPFALAADIIIVCGPWVTLVLAEWNTSIEVRR
jgi:hypothetical protein